jgi:hypothetical protein
MLSRRRRGSVVLALLAALACVAAFQAPRASADDFFVGVDEDAVKWGHTELANSVARALGLRAIRITLPWHTGETRLSSLNRQYLDRAIVGSWGLRVVVSVYGSPADTPRTEESRSQFCSYVGDLLAAYPTIGDVVIWNDPNDGAFWSPQFNPDRSSAAPAEYAALLAYCWSSLHAARPTVNVISLAASRTETTQVAVADAHDPIAWYQKLGAAYRASARNLPLFDTVGYIPHALNSAERPWARHRTTSVGQGDYVRLATALSAAFEGTAQPLPGQNGVTVWYLAQGFQTAVDSAKARLYAGRETDSRAVPAWSPKASTDPRSGPAPDQATQLADAVRVAYCQQHVGAFFNFLLADESRLSGWQSGVLWTDWTVKPSYLALKRAVSDISARRVDCTTFSKAGAPPRPVSTPPAADLKISNLHAASVSAFSATVSWRTTIPAQAQVAYGLPGSGPSLWAESRGSAFTREATLAGLDAARTYRVWVSAVSEDGQRAQTSVDLRTTALPRSPRASIGGAAGSVLLDGQPFFPFVVWSQCPDSYAAILAAGVNLFAENPCGGLDAQLDALGGRAYSAAVAGKEGGSAPHLIGHFLPDEPDGLGLTAAQLPPRPSGSSSQIGFLTLTNHFFSWAAPLPWAVDYPALIAKSDVVGFDLYPLQEFCKPGRLRDVFIAQQELVRLAAPRPTFQWIEAADWSRCPGGPTGVTPETVRAESWLAIAGGAHGLGYFPSLWSPAVGRVIAEVAADVAKLGPALLGPAASATSDNPTVFVSARTSQRATYVIAVNAAYTPARATIRVPGLGTRALNVLNQGRRMLTIGDAFSDDFAPLGVQIYIAAPQ